MKREDQIGPIAEKTKGKARDVGPSPVAERAAVIGPSVLGGAGRERSAGSYRFQEFCRHFWIYALLIGGSIIFVWPFLWMATTSVKVDREMFAEKMRLLPQRPVPAVKSPYVDERYFADLPDFRQAPVFFRIIVNHLHEIEYPWPQDVGLDAIPATARGILKKLQLTLPPEYWENRDVFFAEASKRVDRTMVSGVLSQIRRHLSIGQLRVRSYDLREDQLVAPENVASTWHVGGTAEAKLVQVTEGDESYADMHYDFSKGNTVTLSQTFTTSFPLAWDDPDHPTKGLYRIQLYIRNDDSWHPLTMYVEKLGKLYKAEEAFVLSDFNWGVGTWQEPGPDDRTNKIKSWRLLREIDSGPQYVSDPNKIKIQIEIKQNSALGAWWAKIKRNYSMALDYIPFWRYVGTSVFLVLLNLVATLFSCSLVAYSFARLQWPGRGLCFVLMLATLMIPPQVTMIPYFLIVRHLGWYNTLYPLWVPSLFASAFYVFLLRQFLKGIPRDLEDAAKIDGCGFWRVYWYVMLPLIKPTLAAIGIFTFMGTWNEFMAPLIYLSDQRLYPLSLGLYAFNVQAGSSMGMMMAGSLLMTVPVIVIFFFAQKYFIQGVTLTGMKG